MTERPIFVPCPEGPRLVKEIYFPMVWSPGFALVQKEKNIRALHEAAAMAGLAPMLEISTKSREKIGRHLSAFHLKVSINALGEIPLECAFQGSKVFERGGPYTDLYGAEVKAAKRDRRIRESGRLVGFALGGFRFPVEPKTAFYDWLYLSAVYPHREWLKRLYRYAGYTDIEFNPAKSINCQARSCALFVALMKRAMLDSALSAPQRFVELISEYSYRPEPRLRSR